MEETTGWIPQLWLQIYIAVRSTMFVSPMDELPHTISDEESSSQREEPHNSGKGTPPNSRKGRQKNRSGGSRRHQRKKEKNADLAACKLNEHRSIIRTDRGPAEFSTSQGTYYMMANTLRYFRDKNLTAQSEYRVVLSDAVYKVTQLVVEYTPRIESLYIITIEVYKVLCHRTELFKFSMPFLTLKDCNSSQEELDTLHDITRKFLFWKSETQARQYYGLFYTVLYELLLSFKNPDYGDEYMYILVMNEILSIMEKARHQINLLPSHTPIIHYRKSTFLYYMYIKLFLIGPDKIDHSTIPLYLESADEHEHLSPTVTENFWFH